MPRLSQTAAAPAQAIEFVLSEPLDLMNAMYFTHLARDNDEIDGWPAQVRTEMDPGLLAEIDFLYTFPKEQPGVMGFLGDSLWAHPEAWKDVDSLIAFVRDLTPGIGEAPYGVGIQGFICQAATHGPAHEEERPETAGDPREDFAAALRDSGADVEAALAVYDRPEELRERMIRVIERFYMDHYKPDLPRRWPCLERSYETHRGKSAPDVVELARRLAGRSNVCLEDVCAGPWDRILFTPSLDMGPYTSCAALGKVHGEFYPCEPEFMGAGPEEVEEARLARIYKALGDEQRLRILRMLRDREMYAQEIVERTGLHQSVVSRHLMFMRAVGLVTARRQNNMKFFSLNPQAREELGKTLELFTKAH